ncbi:PAS domain-containing sensor histidine kinase [Wenyingzhuangia sp. IMCC45533]
MKNTGHFNIFDNMIEGVHVLGSNWQYIYANQSMIEQSKYSSDELLGSSMLDLYPGIDKTKLFEYFISGMIDREEVSVINNFTFPDGSTGWFDVRIKPIKEGVLVMSSDITEQKEMQDELKAINETLEIKVKERTSQLMESLEREKELNQMKNSFLSMTSHEFKTPLSAILTSSSLIERYQKSDEQDKREKHCQRINSSVYNLLSMLDYFLSVDKKDNQKDAASYRKINFTKLIEKSQDDLAGMRKKNQSVKYEHKGIDVVYSDEKILRNIIINLLSNALKYSEKDVLVISRIDVDSIELIIKDHGIGIPKQQQSQMFSKYFRAHNTASVDGTGLGLNIVKHYVEILEGSISFTSDENIGTEFSVKLPNKHYSVVDLV